MEKLINILSEDQTMADKFALGLKSTCLFVKDKIKKKKAGQKSAG